MIDWDTDEAAREMTKLTRFEAFLGTVLVKFRITMGQVLYQQLRTAVNKSPNKKTPTKGDRNLNRSGYSTSGSQKKQRTSKKTIFPTNKVKSISPTKKLANSTLRQIDNPDFWLGTATP